MQRFIISLNAAIPLRLQKELSNNVMQDMKAWLERQGFKTQAHLGAYRDQGEPYKPALAFLFYWNSPCNPINQCVFTFSQTATAWTIFSHFPPLIHTWKSAFQCTHLDFSFSCLAIHPSFWSACTQYACNRSDSTENAHICLFPSLHQTNAKQKVSRRYVFP